MRDLAKLIKARFNEDVNHFIVIKYEDSQKHYAPVHDDKSRDWVNNASFFNFTFLPEVKGAARRFQIFRKVSPAFGACVLCALAVKSSFDVGVHLHLQEDTKAKQLLWEQPLLHGSVFKMGSVNNKTFQHAVAKLGKGEAKGVRYSIVARNLASSMSETGPIRTPNYLVTSADTLRSWGFPEEFDFPFLKNCKTVRVSASHSRHFTLLVILSCR